jgi:hypothetical protein
MASRISTPRSVNIFSHAGRGSFSSDRPLVEAASPSSPSPVFVLALPFAFGAAVLGAVGPSAPSCAASAFGFLGGMVYSVVFADRTITRLRVDHDNDTSSSPQLERSRCLTLMWLHNDVISHSRDKSYREGLQHNRANIEVYARILVRNVYIQPIILPPSPAPPKHPLKPFHHVSRYYKVPLSATTTTTPPRIGTHISENNFHKTENNSP